MKTLLINPKSELSYPVLPLGLASLSAYLKEHGREVNIIDTWAENLSYDELANKVLVRKADIIGISVMSPRFNQVEKLVETLRQNGISAKIILGGPHVSALPEETLKKIPGADIAVFGEGEVTLLELIGILEGRGNLAGVNGIAYRDQDGKITRNEPRELIRDINSLPMPDRISFNLEQYRTHPPYGRWKPYLTMITSRGCPFNCAYCSQGVFGKQLRSQKSRRVVDEIAYLINKFGLRELHFYDDDFTMDKNRAFEISQEIMRRGLKIRYSCTTRADLVDKRLLKSLKESGCWLISYGVESGNQEILDNINKGIKLQQIGDAFRWTREAGIKTLGFFMAGLPGDTEKTIKETIKFSRSLKPDYICWSTLQIFPGSELYQRRRKKPIISPERAEEIIKKASRNFYFQPGYILKRLFDIRSLGDLCSYASAAREVLK